MRFFFFRAVIRQRCSIDDERLVGEIRESSVTNSFAKHASPSGRFARKFNMRSIHQTASPPSRVPAWNISGRDVITRFFFLSRVVGKNGWRGVVWGGFGYLCYIRALKRRAEKFVARIFYWKFRICFSKQQDRGSSKTRGRLSSDLIGKLDIGNTWPILYGITVILPNPPPPPPTRDAHQLTISRAGRELQVKIGTWTWITE